MRRAAVTAIAIVSAIAIAGCGLGAGKSTSGVVTLTVTREFGTAPVGSVTEKSIPGSQTVMRMLERSFKVTTRYSGGFVESIDGHAGSSSRLDWFYYVNGIEATLGAAGTSVHKGDRIWWDLHDWTATDSIPAVVGSFPEPFIHGINGRRLPGHARVRHRRRQRRASAVTSELNRDRRPGRRPGDRDRVGLGLARRGRRHVERRPARAAGRR